VHDSQSHSENLSEGDPLYRFILQQILEHPHQRITFAEYIDWALYHPQYGYYVKTRDKIGAKGDFFTSPHLTVDFGELIAEQLAEMWQLLGQPDPFTLVEMGAGQGLLAGDVLQYLRQRYPSCFAALQYWILEKASAHITEQKYRLRRWLDSGLRLAWKGMEDIAPDSIVGCFFSNELVDAFPVHAVTWIDHRLQEIYVSQQENRLIETIVDLSTPQLVSYFDLIGIHFTDAYESGYRTEVNLAALDWMEAVARRLDRGYILTIDYGYTAQRYYNPGRSQGTLQCYYQHSYHNDPYLYIGEQDITAHVDFTALQRQGEKVGLETLGLTQQGLFLMALGLGDRLSQITQTEVNEPQELQNRLQQRDALHQLINPMGLGGFNVLIQGKRLSQSEKTLKGIVQQR
jgi:SAM-dependent MidA family methyltransferase